MTDNISINQHSSIKITGKKTIYFDPFEVQDESHDADIIFVTHEHYDHFDPKSIAKIKTDASILVAPKTMKKLVLSNFGIADSNCVFVEPGQKLVVNQLDVEVIPAYNRLKPFHPKSKQWVGYVVTMNDIRYYVAGDTDDIEDVKQVQCDVALIPIGGTYTMDKKQAANVIAYMKPRVAIPTHYGSVVGNMADGSDFKEYLQQMETGVQVELKM